METTSWPVEGLTLPQIEESAKKVRELKPDLVIAAVPVEASADSKEQYVRSYKWVLNNALSFGYQEWDGMAVVPSVTTPAVDGEALERDRLARALIWAQDIGMVERNEEDARPPEAIFPAWLREQLMDALNTVLDVGDRTQLFMDSRFIAESNNISFGMNPPVKAGAVILPDKPWESGDIGFCVSVVHHEGEYMMWYLARDTASNYCQCFARSRDGRTWEKPELGLIDYQGTKSNNIVLTGAMETTVFMDPVAPPEQRFKAVSAMYWPIRKSRPVPMDLARRPELDTLARTRFPAASGYGNQAFYDPPEEIRRQHPGLGSVAQDWPRRDGQHPRTVAACPAGEALHIWGEDKIPVSSREVPVVLKRDERIRPNPTFIMPPASSIPGRMTPTSCFRRSIAIFRNPGGQFGNDGYLEIHLAVSQDGQTGHGLPGTVCAFETEGALDASQAYMGVGIVRNGMPCTSIMAATRPPTETGVQGIGSIQRLEQRPDGFMYVEAPQEGGTFTTPALIFSGRRLLLNLDGSAGGTGKAALLDGDGNEIAGFTLSDCDALGANSLAREVAWKGVSDVSAWAGKPVRLLFALKAMKLFSFRFAA